MTFRFGAVTTLSLTAIVLVACGGKTISIGNESAAQTVVPSAVTVATSECSQGFEHGNICCTGGCNGSEASCESWPDDPFHPCESGWTTYPNAATCCSLDNPSDCTGSCGSGSVGNQGECQIAPRQTPVAVDAGFGDDAGISWCESRCPPGYTGISPYDEKGCCRYNSDGSNDCFGESNASPSSTPYEDASLPPILLPDGGTYDAGPDDAGVSVDAGYPEVDAGAPSTCAFDCPDGWFVADAVEGVCCNNSSSGGEECFAAVFPDDNGGSGGSDIAPTTGNGTPTPITDASVAPSH
ncbi:MAG: hypothetical protein ABI183_05685 [Polyangiaceae bacterium]